MADDAEPPTRFSLAGTDTAFTSKSADVFASLAVLEKKHEIVQQSIAKDDSTIGLFKEDPTLEDSLGGGGRRRGRDGDGRRDDRGRRDDQGRDFRSREESRKDSQKRDSGGFRVPQGRPPRSKVPGFTRNPEGFTHYNLSDVPEMSDRSNSAAALDFLRTRQKSNDEEMEDDDEDSGKIVFRKPTKKTEAETKPGVTGTGKLVMPEYVVGQKSSATKKSKSKITDVGEVADGSKIGLGHLDTEEDAEEKKLDSVAPTFKKTSKKVQRRRRDDDEDEDVMEESHGSGVKRSLDDDEEEEEEEVRVVRRDRAAERRKKARGQRFVRQQIPDQDEEEEDNEEDWKEELEKARKEEEEAGEGEGDMEDMMVEGV